MASDLSDLSDISDPDVGIREATLQPQSTRRQQGQVEPAQQKFKAVINSAFFASEEDVQEHGLKLGTSERFCKPQECWLNIKHG
jgi:hypothetical protein